MLCVEPTTERLVLHRPIPRLAAALCAAALLSTPAAAQARWTLTETLRIGGEDEGPASFHWLKSLAVDAKGRIFAYEHSTQDIRVFGPDGKHIKTIGRAGSGPGELRNAEGIAFDRSGKLWLRDKANGRFTRFDADGVYEQAWPMTYCYSQGDWKPQMERDGKRILDIDCAIVAGQGRQQLILGYHTDMSKVDTLAIAPECGTQALSEAGTWITRTDRNISYKAIPWAAARVGALAPDGALWCAPNTARYEILRLKPGAPDTLRIRHSRAAVPVTAFEKDSIVSTIEEKGPTGLDFGRIPRTKPMIDRMHVDGDGRLWVRHTDARGALQFDVYDASGRHLATAEMGVHKHQVWAPMEVRGDALYTLITDQDDLPWIVRFAIKR